MPVEYRDFFVHYVDRRSITEKALNLIGLTGQDLGRSFALVAGVDFYPRLPFKDQSLEAAATDLENLKSYLKDVEFFDEVVVLRNEAVTNDHLTYFLQAYFPQRLKAFPKSRFLFAYSGHGIQDGSRGYLLQAKATSFEDKANVINLAALATVYRETAEAAFHSLALINSCHSGAFIRRPFGGRRLLPREPGAHVITAGAGKELTWSLPDVGDGSVFFEKLFAGLDGRADRQPEQQDGSLGDGIITAPEIYAYLDQEIQLETNQLQHPQLGDVSADQSLGSFFFLNRRRQVSAGTVLSWKSRSHAFGASDPPSDPRHTSGEGVFVVTSSGGDELSFESREHQNGYFTHFLVEALGRWREPPTLRQIFEYVSLRVTEAVVLEKKGNQHPQIFPVHAPADLRIGVTRRPVDPNQTGPKPSSAPEFVGTKFAIVVGIGSFSDEKISRLSFAAKDATDFRNSLVAEGKGNFSPEDVWLLVDGGATRASVLSALQSVTLRATPEDMVVIYLNSHGSPRRDEQGLQGKGYLVLYDSRLDSLWLNSISFEELSTLVATVPARRKVIFLDASYSGQFATRP